MHPTQAKHTKHQMLVSGACILLLSKAHETSNVHEMWMACKSSQVSIKCFL